MTIKEQQDKIVQAVARLGTTSLFGPFHGDLSELVKLITAIADLRIRMHKETPKEWSVMSDESY